jgi:hypothetical protein
MVAHTQLQLAKFELGHFKIQLRTAEVKFERYPPPHGAVHVDRRPFRVKAELEAAAIEARFAAIKQGFDHIRGRNPNVERAALTTSDRPGWSSSCHEETHAPQQTAALLYDLAGLGEECR